MNDLFNQSAPKKATNLSINSDLLEKCRALNINFSATLESALQKELAKQAAKAWKQENKFAIQVYNEFVEEHGLFSDDYREF